MYRFFCCCIKPDESLIQTTLSSSEDEKKEESKEQPNKQPNPDTFQVLSGFCSARDYKLTNMTELAKQIIKGVYVYWMGPVVQINGPTKSGKSFLLSTIANNYDDPVISISFSSIQAKTFSEAYEQLKIVLSELYKKYCEALKPNITPVENRTYLQIVNKEASEIRTMRSLNDLVSLLSRAPGGRRSPILIIDDVHIPLKLSQEFGYFEQMKRLMYGIMIFKDHPYLKMIILASQEELPPWEQLWDTIRIPSVRIKLPAKELRSSYGTFSDEGSRDVEQGATLSQSTSSRMQ